MVIIRSRRLPRESAGKSDGCIENQSLGPLICPSSLHLYISRYLSLSRYLPLFSSIRVNTHAEVLNISCRRSFSRYLFITIRLIMPLLLPPPPPPLAPMSCSSSSTL